MRSHLETAGTIAVIVAALALAGAVVHRDFGTPVGPSRGGPPTYVSDWASLVSAGRIVGNPRAPIKIIEFADIQCPYCRRLQDSLQRVRRVLGDSVAIVYVQYPLPMHRFASAGARAAECANSQARFGPMLDALYGKQDSLGVKSWASYAAEAGVPDTARFEQCVRDTAPVPAIAQGLAAGNRIVVTGTPTVIINGWRYRRTPFDSLLFAVERSAHAKH